MALNDTGTLTLSSGGGIAASTTRAHLPILIQVSPINASLAPLTGYRFWATPGLPAPASAGGAAHPTLMTQLARPALAAAVPSGHSGAAFLFCNVHGLVVLTLEASADGLVGPPAGVGTAAEAFIERLTTLKTSLDGVPMFDGGFTHAPAEQHHLVV